MNAQQKRLLRNAYQELENTQRAIVTLLAEDLGANNSVLTVEAAQCLRNLERAKTSIHTFEVEVAHGL